MASNGKTFIKLIFIKLSVLKVQGFDNEIALSKGNWVKLICGASNQDLPAIADLCAVFAAAGVHCVDVAADIAVVTAARQGLDWVQSRLGLRPWLMISLSDGKDVHFRKAWFNPKLCPTNCPRPCQKVCPADAIGPEGGINRNRCYGCGRCLPACPLGLINEKDQHLKLIDFGPLIKEIRPDAVEIHTAPGRNQAFDATLEAITKAQIKFERIAVSCGLEGNSINTEDLAKELWLRHTSLQKYGQKPLWQLDGRPMSGDVGIGTAKVAINLWQKIRPMAPPGPLQIAGGTNAHTIAHLNSQHGPEGIAFGGIARKLLKPLLIEAQGRNINLRDWPEGWNEALAKAEELIKPWLSRGSAPQIC